MSRGEFWIKFTLAALATWRVTHLLANEDGPGDVIVKLRVRLGEGLAGKLIDCFKCLSLWIAAPAALFVTGTRLDRFFDLFFVWLALSGAACLLERLVPESVATEPQTSEGDVSHVLWSETIGSSEHPNPCEKLACSDETARAS